MADDLTKLLSYIVEHPISQIESREVQLDAPAVQNVSEEIAAQIREQRKYSGELAPYFAKGLKMAAQSGGSLQVEDTNPEGDKIADAFARYLVVPGLATSQSQPVSDSNYKYTFDVDWIQLRQLAQNAGIDLDAALGTSR